MSDEMTFTLHSPLTEEEWDMIADVDLDHTSEITFHTKHGKEVVFVKRKTGKWIVSHVPGSMLWECNQCGFDCGAHSFNFCPMCGAKMERK